MAVCHLNIIQLAPPEYCDQSGEWLRAFSIGVVKMARPGLWAVD